LSSDNSPAKVLPERRQLWKEVSGMQVRLLVLLAALVALASLLGGYPSFG
jgi:hypothetical protein